VANDQRRVSETRDEAPTRRTWESMSLTKIGKFEDVLRGATGSKGDGGVGKMA
jgi:hypothetical protein